MTASLTGPNFTGLSLSIKKMVVIVGVSINIHKSPLSMIVSGTNFIVWKYCYFADQEVLTCASKLYLYFGFKAISHIVNIKHTPFAVTSMHLIFLLLAREVIWRGNKPGVITYVGNNILLQDSTKWIFNWPSLVQHRNKQMPRIQPELLFDKILHIKSLSSTHRPFIILVLKTSQELQMLSRSLTDCKSLFLNVMIQVSQFVSNSQLCH